MQKSDCFLLGRITKKHSFKGELVVHLDTDQPEKYQNLESVLLDYRGELVPFFITECLWTGGQKLRVRFEDINNEEEAAKLINCEIFLPLSFLPKLEGNQFYFHEVEGFKAQDEQHGEIGIIEAVSDENFQPLFIIKNQEKEILIPAIDTFIKQIDRENKVVLLSTPDGLIELF
ncbi:MAG: ribosome maturation factor RimM [Schleiferiaceae bacterium]|jgi:16S rRNA processing protein RimM|nr:ribosome maturation factor RimM [Schleiferiaceae bacterium]